MASEDVDREPREPREVKNHMLFEIATEVAHRGMLAARVLVPADSPV
jgi:hypothetical protein